MRFALILALVVAAAAGGGWYWYQSRAESSVVRYRLAKLERGPMAAAVAASGTLNAVATVPVGSQISGQVKDIYADFNTPVKKGQVMALIDPATFELRVNQTRADLDAAESAASVARSSLAGLQAEFGRMKIARAVADRGQPGAGAKRGRGRQTARLAPQAGADRPRAHRHPGAGGRHRGLAQRRRWPDGRAEPAGAGALHHRAGPARHAGGGGDRRGRCGTPARRAPRHVRRRRLSATQLQRRDPADPQVAAERAERGELHGGDLGAESRPDPAPRDDRQRAHRGREPGQRAQGAQRRPALAPPGRG